MIEVIDALIKGSMKFNNQVAHQMTYGENIIVKSLQN